MDIEIAAHMVALCEARTSKSLGLAATKLAQAAQVNGWDHALFKQFISEYKKLINIAKGSREEADYFRNRLAERMKKSGFLSEHEATLIVFISFAKAILSINKIFNDELEEILKIDEIPSRGNSQKNKLRPN